MPLGKGGQSALFSLLKQYLDPLQAAGGGPFSDPFYTALSSAITDWITANGIAAVSLTAATTAVVTTGSPTNHTGAGTLVPKTGVGDVI